MEKIVERMNSKKKKLDTASSFTESSALSSSKELSFKDGKVKIAQVAHAEDEDSSIFDVASADIFSLANNGK
jgi:hypothetical protein